MLDFLILDNKEFNYLKLFQDIDSKVLQVSEKALNNARYGLTDKVNYNLGVKLLTYKSILTWKLSDSSCLCQFELKDIVARIQRLLNTDGPVKKYNTLTGCLPGDCTPIQNFNVNFK